MESVDYYTATHGKGVSFFNKCISEMNNSQRWFYLEVCLVVHPCNFLVAGTNSSEFNHKTNTPNINEVPVRFDDNTR